MHPYTARAQKHVHRQDPASTSPASGAFSPPTSPRSPPWYTTPSAIEAWTILKLAKKFVLGNGGFHRNGRRVIHTADAGRSCSDRHVYSRKAPFHLGSKDPWLIWGKARRIPKLPRAINCQSVLCVAATVSSGPALFF
jgi:hypothetical protein